MNLADSQIPIHRGKWVPEFEDLKLPLNEQSLIQANLISRQLFFQAETSLRRQARTLE